MIAQYEVFLALPDTDPLLHEDMGIITKNVAKAEEVMQRLSRDLGLTESLLTAVTKDETEQLLQAVVAGQLHQLWSIAKNGTAIHLQTKDKRELSNSTVVKSARLVAGNPFDLEITNRYGELETLHIVQGVTAVDPDWLKALAPKQFQIRPGKVYFDARKGRLARRQIVVAHGQMVEGDSEDVDMASEKSQRQFAGEYALWLFENLENESRQLRRRGKKVPSVRLADVQAAVRPILKSVGSLDELTREDQQKLKSLSSIYAWKNTTPQYGGEPPRRSFKRHKQFKPKHKRREKHHEW